MIPTIHITHPTLITRPFHHEGWIYEENFTRRFPGIVSALRKLECATLILDGEVAIYDQRLISRFEWIRRLPSDEVATPLLFMAFDCLLVRGKELRDRPLYVRRNVLEDVLDGQDLVLPVRRLADDGLKAWQQVVEHGWEGLVAKDPASPYVGGRTLKWLKVKQAGARVGAGEQVARTAAPLV